MPRSVLRETDTRLAAEWPAELAAHPSVRDSRAGWHRASNGGRVRKVGLQCRACTDGSFRYLKIEQHIGRQGNERVVRHAEQINPAERHLADDPVDHRFAGALFQYDTELRGKLGIAVIRRREEVIADQSVHVVQI